MQAKPKSWESFLALNPSSKLLNSVEAYATRAIDGNYHVFNESLENGFPIISDIINGKEVVFDLKTLIYLCAYKEEGEDITGFEIVNIDGDKTHVALSNLSIVKEESYNNWY